MQAYIQGGQYRGKTREDFFVEDGVRRMEICWFSSNPNTKLTLIDPDGKHFRDFQVTGDDGTFIKGGVIYTLQIDEPIRGLWTMKAKNIQERYLLHATYDSPLNTDLEMDLEKDEKIHLYFSTKNSTINLEHIHVKALVEYIDIKNQLYRRRVYTNQQGIPKMTIDPFGRGIYNITIQITGETKAHTPFNRTIIESTYFGS